jgi:ribose transport system permease protein
MEQKGTEFKKFLGHTEIVIFIATIVIMAVSYLFNHAVLSRYNMSIMLRQTSFVTIVAFGQTLVLILGDIDLSVGAEAAMAAVLTAMLLTRTAIDPFVVFLMGLGLGALCGLFSGFLITKFRITPFIITLGASLIYTGILNVLTEGRTIQGMPDSFTFIGQGSLLGVIPYPVVFMISLGIILFFVLGYTPFGRYLFAIGGNETAARLVGINVGRVRMIVFMISGTFAALAGMLIMARLGTAQPTVGSTRVMPAITAAVLGGTSMTGGRGGVAGTVIGALMMTVISNSIVAMRISTYWEQVVIGTVVIIAVFIDAIRTRKARESIK